MQLLAQATDNPEPAASQPVFVPLPQLGDTSAISTLAERRLGDRIASALYRDPDYIDDPVLLDYVQRIWQPLLDAAAHRGELTPELAERFAWEIMLGKDRSVNAFALPGGYFGLHLGLVTVVSNRDELASVLAHELSHVTQRHISRLISSQNQQSPWLIGAMILGILAAGKSVDAGNALIVGGQAVAVQSQLNFSRDMEREADRVGFGVMTQAGFEPRGFVSMFDKLQLASRLNDNSSFPYLRSHPLSTERMADMQSRIPLAQGRTDVVSASAEHAIMVARARILSRTVTDELHSWPPQVQAPGFAALTLEQQASTLYGAALAASLLRDSAGAVQYADQLALLVRDQPLAYHLARLLQADVLLAAGKPHAAAARLGLTTAPDGAYGQDLMKTGRAAVLLAARAWLDSGQPERAAGLLQNWLAEHGRDAVAWQLLSRAMASMGQTVQAIRTDAEAQVAVLDYAAAVHRFKAAQAAIQSSPPSSRPADHIEASIIDTRLRQVESLLREQAAER